MPFTFHLLPHSLQGSYLHDDACTMSRSVLKLSWTASISCSNLWQLFSPSNFSSQKETIILQYCVTVPACCHCFYTVMFPTLSEFNDVLHNLHNCTFFIIYIYQFFAHKFIYLTSNFFLPTLYIFHMLSVSSGQPTMHHNNNLYGNPVTIVTRVSGVLVH